MSGGFFRGTSADQDTRFSNKQAKLLKSQKFPAVLDHLVDMTKVKMDVIRPWIATRATEFLGFEDEVLINFVYGLLDGKEVDGKQIQIQLTGFMEKNTGKFMKELWSLLLSAQNNVSGVPQQFLDAKEEETRKKKVETDRIAQEIQKRRDRDGREPQRERKSRFDGEADFSKFTKVDSDLKFSKPRASSVPPEEAREEEATHDSRAKDGRFRSPHPNNRSPSPRVVPSPTRSNNKSISRSRSHSQERHKSKSLSVSSQSPRHSISPRRHYQSPERRSLSPKKWYRLPPRCFVSPRRGYSPKDSRSPVRQRSPHCRRRSRSRHRSSSPFRYRSPLARRRSPRHRSPSPIRHRSPSPLRRTSSSPFLRRSPSPFRRRSPSLCRRSPSPLQRRSPSPSRRRSPIKALRRSPSPLRRRSPIRHRLPPAKHRSPSPLRRRSPLSRSPNHRRRTPLHLPRSRFADSPPQRKSLYTCKSRSPYGSQSPSHQTRRSLSREHDSHVNDNESRWYRDEKISGRDDAKKSLANHALEREFGERTGSKHKVPASESHNLPVSLRSPQRDVRNQSGDRKRIPAVSPENSPSHSQYPSDKRKVNSRTRRRSRSLSKSPIRTKIIRNVPISIRSPQRDVRNQSGDRKRIPAVSQENSPSHSQSPSDMRKVNSRTRRRSRSLSKSPIRTKSIRSSRHDSPGTSKDEERMPRAREVSHHRTDSSCWRSNDSPRDVRPDRREFSQSPSPSGRRLPSELKKKDSKQGSHTGPREEPVQPLPNSSKREYASGRVRDESGQGDHIHDRRQSAKVPKRDVPFYRREHNEQAVNDEWKHKKGGDEYSEVMNNSELHYGIEPVKSKKKMDEMENQSRLNTRDSDPEETNSYRNDKMEKRRYKKSDKRKRDYDETSESDSQMDDKKEAKRRRKDERRLRKEERRQRREERHCRKLERRAGKLKMKSVDTVSPPSDFEKVHCDADDSDGGAGRRKSSHTCDADETESEQKRLEIELREKALESLRAKKAISH